MMPFQADFSTTPGGHSQAGFSLTNENALCKTVLYPIPHVKLEVTHGTVGRS